MGGDIDMVISHVSVDHSSHSLQAHTQDTRRMQTSMQVNKTAVKGKNGQNPFLNRKNMKSVNIVKKEM
eukprot:g79680.t1